jgi:hypothetical protein
MEVGKEQREKKAEDAVDPASDCYLSTNTENMPSQVDELEPLFRVYSGAITETAASV